MKTEFHPSIDCPDHGPNPVVCFTCWCRMLAKLTESEKSRELQDAILEELRRQIKRKAAKAPRCDTCDDPFEMGRHTCKEKS